MKSSRFGRQPRLLSAALLTTFLLSASLVGGQAVVPPKKADEKPPPAKKTVDEDPPLPSKKPVPAKQVRVQVIAASAEVQAADKVIATVSRGQVLPFTKKDKDYYLVIVDGKKGWIKREEVREVEVAIGFPLGTALALALGRKEYPAVSINAGSITSRRRKEDRLHRIQLDVALNPGNSGGPVLDENGKVLGVVVAGVRGRGVNFAIPVNAVADSVARPELERQLPSLDAANRFNSVTSEAGMVPLLLTITSSTIDLSLKRVLASLDAVLELA